MVGVRTTLPTVSLLRPSTRSINSRRNEKRAPRAKAYKLKTKKAAAARFKVLGTGTVKFWHAGRVHNSQAKSNKQRRQLKRAKYAKGSLLRLLKKCMPYKF